MIVGKRSMKSNLLFISVSPKILVEDPVRLILWIIQFIKGF